VLDELHQSIGRARSRAEVIADYLGEAITGAEVAGLPIRLIALQAGRHLEAPATLLRIGDLNLDVLCDTGSISIAVRKQNLNAALSGIQRLASMAKGACTPVIAGCTRVSRVGAGAVGVHRSVTERKDGGLPETFQNDVSRPLGFRDEHTLEMHRAARRLFPSCKRMVKTKRVDLFVDLPARPASDYLPSTEKASRTLPGIEGIRA
jgi:hypothetical protein